MKESITLEYEEFPGMSSSPAVVGRCLDLKGIVAQGEAIDEVRIELLKLIRIKYEINMSELKKEKND